MREKLATARLYGILDLGYTAEDDLYRVAEAMIRGGVDIVQLRAKEAPAAKITKWSSRLLPLFRRHDTPFIVNDHPNIAAEVEADGVHAGQDDGSTEEVRAVVGEEMIVGRSTHSVSQAAAAASHPGTDYIGFGPLFATPTKPDYTPIGTEDIAQVQQNHPALPVFCIGGIKKENLPGLIESGVRRAVIVSGILQAPSVEKYVAECKSLLSSHI